MKHVILAVLLSLAASAALAQSEPAWNIAAASDPVWQTDPDFIAPPL